jgi:hypothetical protein
MMWSIGKRSARRGRVMSCAFLGKGRAERKTGVPARTFVAAIMAIAALASSSPASAGPMELSGTFAVSESGGATYSIPIAVPPGTAGMMPSLSLGYDSQRSSGIVGVGWSLNGFSAIRRCAETRAQDPSALSNGRVGFDAADRFCLDGQRLMVVTGTYGANLSEYRTEIEGFRKVTAQGTAGVGPSWFEVRLPSGRVLQYGNTVDSKILAKGKTSVRVWALNRITDTKGNYLTITYNNDTTNGTYYPTRIDYTGNATAGLATYASVQFSYVARPATDQVTAYIAGSSVKLTLQLSEIKTYTGGTQVLSYKLGYENTTPATPPTPANTATGVTRLTSVQMCDAANLCQPATSFTWSNDPDDTFTFGPWQMWLAAPGAAASSKPSVSHSNKKTGWKKTGSAPALEAYEGDIDGDGRADALINNNSAILVSLSNGSTAFTTPVSTGITTYSPALMDIFGTGKNDIVSLSATSQLVRYANNGMGGFNTTPTVLLAAPGVGHPVFPNLFTPIFSDINGDGLPDMVWHGSTNVFKYALNTGTNFATPVTITLPASMNVKANFCTANLNCNLTYADVSTTFANLSGRGNVDLVLTFNGQQAQSCTGGQNPICTKSGDPAWQVWTMRWNGSGYATAVKLVSIVHDATNMCGPPGDRVPCPDLYPPVTTRITDVNGDGLSDLFLSYPAMTGEGNSFPANQRIYVGNGSTFNTFAAGGLPAASCPTGLAFRDMYGSGRSDGICENDTALRISRPNAAATAYTALVALPNAAATGEFWLKDFNGDGYLDILVQRATNNNYWVALSTRVGGAPSDLVTGITSGLGATTTITYDALSSNATANGQPIYTRGPLGTYPSVVEVPDDYVVTRVERSNGIGGTFASAYRYEGWQRDLKGRGTLGPTKVISTDLGTNVQTATTYRLDYPYTGLLASEVKSVGAVTLSNVTNTHTATNLAAGTTRFLPLLSSSVAAGADLDGSPLPSVTMSYQYDAFGNPTLVTATASDGFGKTTSTTYTNDTTRWILGLPTQSQVTQTTP